MLTMVQCCDIIRSSFLEGKLSENATGAAMLAIRLARGREFISDSKNKRLLECARGVAAGRADTR